jgi:DNA-binding SARP family transcriptional activator
LAASVALRWTVFQLLDTIGHLQADVTGAARPASAAALRGRYPAFVALLAYGLAAAPVTTLRQLDEALLDLALQPDPTLDDWVRVLAAALTAPAAGPAASDAS